MLQQAKWLCLSLVLHLAVATNLFFWVVRDDKQTPHTITVILDEPVPMGIPRHKVSQMPVHIVTRPVVQNRLPQPVKHEVAHQEFQQAIPHVPQPDPVQKLNSPAIPQRVPATAPVAAVMRRKDESADAAINSQSEMPVLPSTKEQPQTDNDQQRYRKEHFIYIRELITKHLVYPPLARKMNWSGKVVVSFTVAEDGSANKIRVTETSGFPILDKSALDTIRKVAPFPKPPVRAEIVVPINFKMAP